MIRIVLLLATIIFVFQYNNASGKREFIDGNAKNEEFFPQTVIAPTAELPLKIEYAADNNNMPLAFFISGDGGWAEFNQGVSKLLSQKGIAVVGLDSRKYFCKEKQPLETTNDIATVVNFYLKKFNRSSFILIGYSFGACIAPFIVNNFQPSVKEKLKGVYCFSPDITGDFEIHVADMLNLHNVGKYDVLKEMGKISALNPICVFADEEDRNTIKQFKGVCSKVIELPGGHHYNNNLLAVARIVYSHFVNKK